MAEDQNLEVRGKRMLGTELPKTLVQRQTVMLRSVEQEVGPVHKGDCRLLFHSSA